MATLTPRLPRRAPLVGALLVLAVANLATAFAPNFEVLLLTRVLAAAGAAAYSPGATAMVTGLNASAIYAGIALGTVVGGIAVPHGVALAAGRGAGLAAAACLYLAATARHH